MNSMATGKKEPLGLSLSSEVTSTVSRTSTLGASARDVPISSLLPRPGEPPIVEVRHRDSDCGALVAGHLSARCHWRACRLQALRDPRSILVGEW